MCQSSRRITELCTEKTLLTPDDIHVICHMAKHLSEFREDTSSDLFIEVPTKINSEFLIVAQELSSNTGYPFSMIGYFIREMDEPAVARTLLLGEPTYGVAAHVLSQKGGGVFQYVEPIINNNQAIGAIVKEIKDCGSKEGVWEMQSKMSTFEKRKKEYPYLKNVDWMASEINDALLITNQEEVVLFVNQLALQLYDFYGYYGPIVGEHFGGVLLQGPLEVTRDNSSRIATKEVRARGRLLQMKQCRCSADGQEFYMIILKDISALKHSEAMLNVQKAAVQEIQHRVKNNLYTIYNLLEMQGRRSESEEVKNTLQVTMNRILSLATPYEILLKKRCEKLPLYDLILHVCRNFEIMNSPDLNIKFQIADISAKVTLDIATNLTLVLNELIQNCYKHAFVGRRSGNISITTTDEVINMRLTVKDDGVGCDANYAQTAEKTLGLKVVNDIVTNQLDGRLIVESSVGGTAVSVVFRSPSQFDKKEI